MLIGGRWYGVLLHLPSILSYGIPRSHEPTANWKYSQSWMKHQPMSHVYKCEMSYKIYKRKFLKVSFMMIHNNHAQLQYCDVTFFMNQFVYSEGCYANCTAMYMFLSLFPRENHGRRKESYFLLILAMHSFTFRRLYYQFIRQCFDHCISNHIWTFRLMILYSSKLTFLQKCTWFYFSWILCRALLWMVYHLLGGSS